MDDVPAGSPVLGHRRVMGEDPALRRLHRVIDEQHGVVARRQVIECGVPSAYIRSRLHVGAWVAAFPGVYVTHTGPLPRWQRVWCAVLDAEPAALAGRTALRAGSPRETGSSRMDAAAERASATTRLGWGQSAVRPCLTAVKLGRLFIARGWTEAPTPCSSLDCAVRRSAR